MKLDTKAKVKIGILYGLIVAASNIVGVLIPNIFQSPDVTTDVFNSWLEFLYNNKLYFLSQYLTFIIPTALCIIYPFTGGKNKVGHFINLPGAYSTFGISGWLCAFILEFTYLNIAVSQGYNIDFSFILKTSALNLLLEAIVTFSLSYFITETIHRKFVLPKYFPEGNLNKYPGTQEPKIGLLFFINYISVTLFPVVFLLSVIFYLNRKTGDSLSYNTFIILFIILFIGLVITLLLNTFFAKPLDIIKKRIVKIKEGDYKSKIKFVANDSFGELSDAINDMTESIDLKTQKIFEIQNSVITGMATMVESRDNSTGGHIKRTSDCVRIFAEHLKTIPEYSDLTDSFYEAVIKAAPMHDLGKIAVDDAILRKPGKFTDEEYEKMKAHSAEGARIVENVLSSVDDQQFKQIAINVAHYHHEKWNGQGYPEKISRTEIPLEARIMALADVFDALVSKRCYKDSFTYDKAFQIIEEDLGTHFDPQLGLEFIKCRPDLEALYNSY